MFEDPDTGKAFEDYSPERYWTSPLASGRRNCRQIIDCDSMEQVRVFVSSTCYDLIDLRAEVEAHLRDLGFSPLMSDRPSSDFAEFAVKNSIDACLANLADAEIFVCVVSQRYGPSLKDAGFEDLSATHAELRAAHKLKKPIFLYARDRFVADYGIWKSTPSAKLNWVKPSDVRIFEMFAEHEKLAPGKTNWVTVFRDSFELRGLLSQHLSGFSGRELLARWMREGRLPGIGVTGDSKKVVSNNEFALGIRISMRSTDTQVFGVKVAVSGETDCCRAGWLMGSRATLVMAISEGEAGGASG